MPTSPDSTADPGSTGSGSLWVVYILRCSDKTLYTGITNNLERRLREHNGEIGRGARYTRPRRPVSVAYSETALNRQTASQREAALKALSRAEKEQVIAETTSQSADTGCRTG